MEGRKWPGGEHHEREEGNDESEEDDKGRNGLGEDGGLKMSIGYNMIVIVLMIL